MYGNMYEIPSQRSIKMNVLMVGPDEWSSTDGMIILGIKYLLERSLKDQEVNYKYIILKNSIPQNAVEFDMNSEVDLVVVCGTPWLWDSFQDSVKYQNLATCFSKHPNAKRVFMGIGSCLPLEWINSDLCRRPEEVAGIKKLFEGSTIIVRDHIAKDILDFAGIENYHLPCPAFFSNRHEKVQLIKSYNRATDENALIYTDPRLTLSASLWQDPAKVDEYHSKVKEFYHEYRPLVYCVSSAEQKSFMDLGLPKPKLIRTYQDTVKAVENARRILSGRVHCAVPGYGLHIENGYTPVYIDLMDIDSRVFTFTNFNNIYNFDPYEVEYIKILNKELQ